MTDIEQEARAEAGRVVSADVVLAAVRTIGIGLSAARGASERAVAISNTRVRLARLIDQIEGQARPASPEDPVKLRAERYLFKAVALRQVQYRKTQVARLTRERAEALAIIEQVRTVMFDDERSSVVLATIRAIVNRQELAHDR